MDVPPILFAVHGGEIEARLEKFAVSTSHAIIQKSIADCKSMPKDEAKFVFRQTFQCITKFTDQELILKYRENGKDWRNWCDDLLIFYTLRFVLLGRSIPIYEMTEEEYQVVEDRDA